MLGDDLPMKLTDLKKVADALDNNSKLELLQFLKSRITGITPSTRVIDEIRNKSMFTVNERNTKLRQSAFSY